MGLSVFGLGEKIAKSGRVVVVSIHSMTRNVQVHFLWFSIAAAAFFAGSRMSYTEREAGVETPVRNAAVREESGSGRGGRVSGNLAGGAQSDVRPLAERAFRSSDPVEGAIAFGALLKNLTPQSAEMIEREFVGRKGLGVTDAQRRLFRYAWGSIDGMGAAKYAVEHLGGEILGLFLQEMLPGWGNGDPESGMAWIDGPGPKEVDDSIRRRGSDFDRYGGMLETSRSHFILGMADWDIGRATEYAYQKLVQGDLGDALDKLTSKAIQQSGFTGAAEWAQNLPDGPPKSVAMQGVTSAWVSSDPQAAAKWVESHAGKDWAQGAMAIIRKRGWGTAASGR